MNANTAILVGGSSLDERVSPAMACECARASSRCGARSRCPQAEHYIRCRGNPSGRQARRPARALATFAGELRSAHYIRCLRTPQVGSSPGDLATCAGEILNIVRRFDPQVASCRPVLARC